MLVWEGPVHLAGQGPWGCGEEVASDLMWGLKCVDCEEETETAGAEAQSSAYKFGTWVVRVNIPHKSSCPSVMEVSWRVLREWTLQCISGQILLSVLLWSLWGARLLGGQAGAPPLWAPAPRRQQAATPILPPPLGKGPILSTVVEFDSQVLFFQLSYSLVLSGLKSVFKKRSCLTWAQSPRSSWLSSSSCILWCDKYIKCW